eukprot:562171-Amorphochlora_amoeboformis.AAC.1
MTQVSPDINNFLRPIPRPLIFRSSPLASLESPRVQSLTWSLIGVSIRYRLVPLTINTSESPRDPDNSLRLSNTGMLVASQRNPGIILIPGITRILGGIPENPLPNQKESKDHPSQPPDGPSRLGPSRVHRGCGRISGPTIPKRPREAPGDVAIFQGIQISGLDTEIKAIDDVWYPTTRDCIPFEGTWAWPQPDERRYVAAKPFATREGHVPGGKVGGCEGERDGGGEFLKGSS